MNMMDYLDWRGDITFQERELNEVDNLIFSTLVYLKMDGLISGDASVRLTIDELCQACEAAETDTSGTTCDPMKLLRKAASTDRFRNVTVCYYRSLYDAEEQVQFAAVTFKYAADKYYAAFRGTDNTITGWREDCNFSYALHTPGQTAAADYLSYVLAQTDGTFTAGGHSKGGNFAVYACAFCDKRSGNDRITKIYSNDGPGFNSEIADSENYMSILNILEKIIPESSIVGILLSSKARRKVITSTAKSVNQHNPYTWNVSGTHFTEADSRSIASIALDRTLSSWISSLDAHEKQLIIDSVFDALESSGAETMQELNSQKKETFFALLKAAVELDPEKRKEIAGAFGKFFASGKDTLYSNIIKIREIPDK